MLPRAARQGTNGRGKTWSHLAQVGELREKDGGSVQTTATLKKKTKQRMDLTKVPVQFLRLFRPQ